VYIEEFARLEMLDLGDVLSLIAHSKSASQLVLRESDVTLLCIYVCVCVCVFGKPFEADLRRLG